MKSTPQTSISSAEWVIMEIVWAADEALTSEAIIANLPAKTDWSDGTVRSLLNRLIKKDALATERQGRQYLYRANRAKSECQSEKTSTFLDHYFGGKLSPMLASFLGTDPDQSISEEELAELEALIQQHRNREQK